MLIVHMISAFVGAIATFILLWPVWGWAGLIFTPFGGSLAIVLFALILDLTGRLDR